MGMSFLHRKPRLTQPERYSSNRDQPVREQERGRESLHHETISTERQAQVGETQYT